MNKIRKFKVKATIYHTVDGETNLYEYCYFYLSFRVRDEDNLYAEIEEKIKPLLGTCLFSISFEETEEEG